MAKKTFQTFDNVTTAILIPEQKDNTRIINLVSFSVCD